MKPNDAPKGDPRQDPLLYRILKKTMNILLTSVCNRHCPYCFAKSKLERRALPDAYMSLKNLEILLDFVKKSKDEEIRVLGGEPTLHPRFKKAMTMIMDRRFKVMIFSNGLFAEEVPLFLKKFDAQRLGMMINLNDPRTYTKKEWRMVNRTAQLLGPQATVGFNIYQPRCDMDYLATFIRQHNLYKKIRLGIAQPVFGGDNQYLASEDYAAMTAHIVGFVERHYAQGLGVVFDCGFTLCSFTDEQLGKLLRCGSIPKFYCLAPVDVGTDLTTWMCFPTAAMWNKKLTDFKDMNDLYRFYRENFKALKSIGSKDECLKCQHLVLGHCAGGCLGRVLKKFKDARIGRLGIPPKEPRA